MADFYVSIGNSDNRLEQASWHRFCKSFESLVVQCSQQIYGIWYTLPNSPYQGMCIGMRLSNRFSISTFKKDIAKVAEDYHQDSIAVTLVSVTEFVGPHANDGFNRISRED